MSERQIKSWYGPCGALVTDGEITGVTHRQNDEHADYYGGRFFIAESMTETAARKISEALNLNYQGQK
jgi:c-di-AMP phosphodiesterase-like protein